MQKIAIIGCPGAGKSTLARRIAEHTSLPLYHLDSFYFQQDKDYQNDTDTWRKRVTELTSQGSWIIDGNYKSTLDIRLPAADTIIYLDYPTRICVWRTFKRRVKYHNKTRPDMASGWKEKIDPNFLSFILSFRITQRPRVLAMLRELSGKNIVILDHPRNLERYLQSMRRA